MCPDDASFPKQVGEALARLHNPAYLGTCSLARSLSYSAFLLTQERGKALQKLLREAIEYLKPSGKHAGAGSNWRLYPILYSTYVKGHSPRRVMGELAISRATFYREHERAIDAVCDFLREKEKDLRSPLVSPAPIPRSKGFVGRQEEMAYYRRQLESERLALISGLAGVGKTALGAELAGEWQEHSAVVWFRFYRGRNTHLEAVLEDLALSLAALGQDEYWRFLQADRRRECPLSPAARIRYLVNLLAGGDYTLCFDNCELADDRASIRSLFEDLLRSAQAGESRLLVMSRARPSFASGRAVRPLGGLCREDARQLLAQAGLSALPQATFVRLHDKTGGLPVALKLFAGWVHGRGLAGLAGEPIMERVENCVEHLVRQPDMWDYVLREVYEALRPAEQRLLEIISAFRATFDERDAGIAQLLASEGLGDVDAALDGLVQRHLLAPDAAGDLQLHPLIQEYFFGRLARRPDDKQWVHSRLAGYYQEQEDPLEAAYHYSRAGELQQAAKLLSENVTQLINAGQAEAALEQLEELLPRLIRTAGAELRFEAAVAREALCHVLGQRERQKTALSTLLTLAEELGDDQRRALAHNLRARFYDAVADYAAAIAAAQAGQAAARRAGDRAAEGESLQRWGLALWSSGDYEAARGRHEQALALARQMGDWQGEAVSLRNLGMVWHGLDDYVAAQASYEQALVTLQAVGDERGEASVLNNLGIVCLNQGDYGAARGFYEQALAILRAVGERLGEAATLNNLGVLCSELGDYTAAQTYHEQAQTIRRAIGDRRGEATSLGNLGETCQKEGNYAVARGYHEQALAIKRAIDDRRGTGYALTYLGMTLEGLGDLAGAEAAYREALTLRREVGQAALAIDDVAGLGRVALARSEGSGGVGEQGSERGGMEEARQCAEECLAHIASHGIVGVESPFEVYLTCIRILQACGDAYAARVREILEQAYTLLMERADKIGDEALRRSFLENVAANRKLVREAQQLLQAPGSTE